MSQAIDHGKYKIRMSGKSDSAALSRGKATHSFVRSLESYQDKFLPKDYQLLIAAREGAQAFANSVRAAQIRRLDAICDNMVAPKPFDRIDLVAIAKELDDIEQFGWTEYDNYYAALLSSLSVQGRHVAEEITSEVLSRSSYSKLDHVALFKDHPDYARRIFFEACREAPSKGEPSSTSEGLTLQDGEFEFDVRIEQS